MWNFILVIISSIALAEGNPEIPSTAGQVGFSQSSFKSYDLRGFITTSCRDGGRYAATCRADILQPYEFDYFYGPKDIKADSVQLTAHHQDGSSRTKIEKYKSDLGRSKGRFNLWIASLTQRPLLDYGQNNITYRLTLNDKIVAEGEFQVIVEAGPSLRCPDHHYFDSMDPNCNTPAVLCDRYFYEHNYCQ